MLVGWLVGLLTWPQVSFWLMYMDENMNEWLGMDEGRGAEWEEGNGV